MWSGDFSSVGFSSDLRVCGVTDALRDALGAIAPPAYYRYDEVTATVRARLGEAAWEDAWRAGHAMPLEQAIAYILDQESLRPA
jgi:hypothetical protein